MPNEVRVIGVEGMPEMGPGDDLAGLMMDAAAAQGTPIEEGDILVVTQKVVSKVEGKVMSYEDVEASPLAITITEGHRRDPRHTEMILRESVRIVRMDRGVIIAETKHGFYLRQRRDRRLQHPWQQHQCPPARRLGRLGPGHP